MHNTPLQRRRLSDIEAAIGRAKTYAETQGVPLTVERLAAELDMDLGLFHRILQGQDAGKSRSLAAKIAAIQKAGGEATASVMEHAMRRGTSPNMHILYLKNHAGYDVEKGKNGRDEAGPMEGPVIFMGEEEIAD
ncbi:MAG: hypothetical protein E7527_04195 [Ruminococcaceae bacterium]|nr:hypothetical protein [Oscillospiraceae bacterium]